MVCRVVLPAQTRIFLSSSLTFNSSVSPCNFCVFCCIAGNAPKILNPESCQPQAQILFRQFISLSTQLTALSHLSHKSKQLVMCFYSHFNFRILSAKKKDFITKSGPPGNTKGHAVIHWFLACPTFFLALSSLCPQNTRCYKGTTGIKGMHFLHSTL